MHSEFWLTADVFTKYFHCRSPLCWIPADAENKMKIIIIHLHNLIIKKYRSIPEEERGGKCVRIFFPSGWLTSTRCEVRKSKNIISGFSYSFISLSVSDVRPAAESDHENIYRHKFSSICERAHCLRSCVQFLSYSHRCHWRCRKEQIGMKKM